MKILVITQKIDKNDPILGFFHNWVCEFAKNVEEVRVVCLYKGEHSLPDNVKVFSLGKEERQSRLQYLIHFFWYIIHERKSYDAVFVHMNQIYVALGGLLWRMWGKKIGLWYTHRAIDLNLRIATILAHHIFTASKEGFRIPTRKLIIAGHGIPFNLFVKKESVPHTTFTLLSVSRITRIKNLDTLVEAIDILVKSGMQIVCRIIGPQVTPDDTVYYNELIKLVHAKNLKNTILFSEAVQNDKIREFYWNSDVNINLSPTGGVDKVVLEGIAASIIPLVSNKAFIPIFGRHADKLVFEERNPQDLAEKIKALRMNSHKDEMLQDLQNHVRKDFGLENLIRMIISTLKK